MFLPIFLLILGLAILIFGAEILVRGSASLAKKLGISSMVVGLTVVAFGTSAPELVVNIFSAVRGTADIAIGNVIGSNIANILLILGVTVIITPLKVKTTTVFKEIPFALLAMILVYIMGNDSFFDKLDFNAITRTDGMALIALFIIFMFYVFALSKIHGKAEDVKIFSWPISLMLTIAGLICLFFGGKILIDNAIILAKSAGLSESLIGLTIVAIGTSLPELITSIIAALHKHNDIAIGNIIGSNIFNVFWILGITSTILPLPFNTSTNLDVFVGIFSTILLFLSMFIGKKHSLERWQGIIFILLYISYIIFLIQRG